MKFLVKSETRQTIYYTLDIFKILPMCFFCFCYICQKPVSFIFYFQRRIVLTFKISFLECVKKCLILQDICKIPTVKVLFLRYVKNLINIDLYHFNIMVASLSYKSVTAVRTCQNAILMIKHVSKQLLTLW